MCETKGLPPLALDCGVDDFLIDDNRRLPDELTAGGVAHSYGESEGGHEWPYWRRRLPVALRFFADRSTLDDHGADIKVAFGLVIFCIRV